LERHVTDELSFGVAATEAEQRAAFELRYLAITESRWRPSETFPDRMEQDADDAAAVHLVARLSGQVVGTMRLVVETARVAELLEEFELDNLYEADETMFAVRLTVARPHRNRSRERMVGLYAELIAIAAARGIRRAITFLAENAVRFYSKQGFPLKLVGQPREDTGVLRRPAVFDVEVLESFMRTASDAERSMMVERGAPAP
jgi:N-acyl-L-homoserine lactone synthetase